tara:strand:+ start:149 stop:373 length:225 start_codon:yes stop_codon:yes gene_type:complete
MVFKRNKKFSSCVILKEESKGRWMSDKPLFTCGSKGLYPVFKTGGPTGVFPKNHQEFILKDIKEDKEEDEFSGL